MNRGLAAAYGSVARGEIERAELLAAPVEENDPQVFTEAWGPGAGRRGDRF